MFAGLPAAALTPDSYFLGSETAQLACRKQHFLFASSGSFEGGQGSLSVYAGWEARRCSVSSPACVPPLGRLLAVPAASVSVHREPHLAARPGLAPHGAAQPQPPGAPAPSERVSRGQRSWLTWP